jgi:hypothetical protein
MKHIRALIKMEAKPAVLVGIYFLLINLVGLVITHIHINKNYIEYLRTWGEPVTSFSGEIFSRLIYFITPLSFLGMIVLSYAQFKQDKNVETGRFLKALPYTNLQRCFVKVIMGVLSYSLPFIVFAVGCMLLRVRVLGLYEEVYTVIAYGDLLKVINGAESLIWPLVLSYLVYTAFYLFLVMMQYLVSSNAASLIIGILSMMAPAFIAFSFFEIYGYQGMRVTVDQVLLPVYGVVFDWQLKDLFLQTNWEQYITYRTINYMTMKLIITSLVSIVCVGVIYRAAKRSKIEEADVLMPYKAVRWIFILGVSLCTAFTAADTGRFILFPVFMEKMNLAVEVTGVIGGIIGFVIAKKIAYIGLRQKKKLIFKKITALGLCLGLLTGCDQIENEVNAYQAEYYGNTYYKIKPVEGSWGELFDAVLNPTDVYNKDDGFQRMEINEDGKSLDITIKDIESESCKVVVDKLNRFIGEEFGQVIEEVKNSKKDKTVVERVIGGYGVICTSLYKNLNIRIINAYTDLVDVKSEEMYGQINTSHFMLSEMSVGKESNRMRIATPLFMQNSLERQPGSYYEIYRENSGKLTKVRFVMSSIQETMENDHESTGVSGDRIEEKHLQPLRNIISYIGKETTDIDSLFTEINAVYKGDKIKSKGKIESISYKINKYSWQDMQSGELTEVVVTFD